MDVALFLVDVHDGNRDFLLRLDFVFARKRQDEYSADDCKEDDIPSHGLPSTERIGDAFGVAVRAINQWRLPISFASMNKDGHT